MRIPLFQVDAFTSKVFAGNPAAVCLLDSWLEDSVLQAIAAENNLSETAFLVANETGYDLRWFTPLTEVVLCGHATLASAYVLFKCLRWPQQSIRFRTRKSGELVVTKQKSLFEMDFPARLTYSLGAPAGLTEALRVKPLQVLGSEEDLLVILDSEATVRSVQPDFAALDSITDRGVIITARGDRSDFVSRFFAPRVGIPEDPVTGSAHCVLIPHWAGVLAKNDLHAFQVSKRGGEIFGKNLGHRVMISGRAALYLKGSISL
ncbi:MAG TPA: PhzF family phenazine biosynthesis protein [Acidobacteriota bacterium]|nr:PhzF family phenazine biosynthesis protein [Acidobacteriota bacterium]